MVLKRENYYARKKRAPVGIEPYTNQFGLTYYTFTPSGLYNKKKYFNDKN
jgi:hypothetical protein